MRERDEISAGMIEFESSRFGVIRVEGAKVIRLVRGMPGFEGLRDFVLLDHDSDGVFKWLQSIEDPGVAFLLTYPRLFKSGYTVPLRDNYLQDLGASSVDSIVVFVMVSASEVKGSVSLNLKAPVLLNTGSMLAMQCIIDRDEYECRFAVELAGLDAAREDAAKGA